MIEAANRGGLVVFLWCWRNRDRQTAMLAKVNDAVLGLCRLHGDSAEGARFGHHRALFHAALRYRPQDGHFDLDQKGPVLVLKGTTIPGGYRNRPVPYPKVLAPFHDF